MSTKESYRNSIINNLERKKRGVNRRQFLKGFVEASVFFNASQVSRSAIDLAIDNLHERGQIPEYIADLPKKMSEELKHLDSKCTNNCSNDDWRINRKHPLGYSQDNRVRVEKAVQKDRKTENIENIVIGGSMVASGIVFANHLEVSRRDVLKRAARGGLSGAILQILKSFV